MPTYEFRCGAGHATDRFFSTISTSPAEIECPVCGEPALRQVSGGIGLVFKGSGFYITDYGKDGKRPRAGEKSEATAGEGERDSARQAETKGSDLKSEAGKEGKPAGKADPATPPAKPKKEE